jgi:GMP synthase (glutamine-hydrolysing)
MDIVVLRHLFSNGPGSLGLVLDKLKLPYRVIDAWDYDFSGFDAYKPDLLIIMGGSPGVYQMDDYPFIKQEVSILEKRLARDLPTLGICLGAQMMAKALGADVYKGDAGLETGWGPLHITPDGEKTPVRHLDGKYTSMVHWHGDTFDLPKNTSLLASSARYENQAFSFGQRALALQFHPEMTPHIMKEWLVKSAPSVMDGRIDLQNSRKETEQFGPALMKQTEIFFREWLAQVDVVGAGPGRATI